MNTFFSKSSSNSSSTLLNSARSILGSSSIHDGLSRALSSLISSFGLRCRNEGGGWSGLSFRSVTAFYVPFLQICNCPVSGFKGCSLLKEAKEHLVSRGLQNAFYTIKTSDLKDDLFGALVPCTFQEAAPSTGVTSSMDFAHKRPNDVLGSENSEIRNAKKTCVLEFDGDVKGIPWRAGAGVVLRTLDGTVICNIRQGLGKLTVKVTKFTAEYRAIILGLNKALELGYTSVQAQGESELPYHQLQGLWKARRKHIVKLHDEATKLKRKVTSFQIRHVQREVKWESL